jgi:hypothetical protein
MSTPSSGFRLVDAAVYLPIGVALAAADHVPELIERGRTSANDVRGRVERTLGTARSIGQLTVVLGERRLRSRLGEVANRSRPAPAAPATPPVPPAAPPTRTAPAPTAPAARSTAKPKTSRPTAPKAAAAKAAAPKTAASKATASPAPAAELPIEGYDDLAASQIVARLAGLPVDALRAVQAHEEAGRGRRTVLTRVEQLLDPGA